MNRRIVSFGLFGALLLASVWYLTAYRSQSDQLLDIHAQAASVNADTSHQQATAQQLRTAQSALDEHHDRIIQLTEAVPEKAELADFLATVNALAAKFHVTIDSISQTPPAKATAVVPAPTSSKAGGSSPSVSTATAPADASTMSVALSAQGTYENVMAFMHGLDTLPRLVVIDSVSLTPAQIGSVATATTSLPSAAANQQTNESTTTTSADTGNMSLALNIRVFTNQSSLEASA